VQSIRGPREVPLFGQDNDCVQVTDFEVGEHGSSPSLPNGGDWLRLHLVKEPEAKKKYQKENVGLRGLSSSEALTDAGCGWHAVCDLAI